MKTGWIDYGASQIFMVEPLLKKHTQHTLTYGKVVPTKLRVRVPQQSCFSSLPKHGERQVKAKFGFLLVILKCAESFPQSQSVGKLSLYLDLP